MSDSHKLSWDSTPARSPIKWKNSHFLSRIYFHKFHFIFIRNEKEHFMLGHCVDSHEQSARINFTSTARRSCLPSAQKRASQPATQAVVCYIGHVFLPTFFFHTPTEINYNSLAYSSRELRREVCEESLFSRNLLVSVTGLRQWRLLQLIWDCEAASTRKIAERDVTIVLRPSITFVRQLGWL